MSSEMTELHSTVSVLKPVPSQQNDVWQYIIKEAQDASEKQPLLASFFHNKILKHSSIKSAIAYCLSSHLSTDTVPAITLQSIIFEAIDDDPEILESMLSDLLAHYTRDAACDEYMTPLLFFKGFHAIQSYRIGNWLWKKERRVLALYFQNRISELFDVDIHPGASLGSGLMLDHATGVVIGETAVIGNDVSMLHSVTLGGSGCEGGNRHPKVGNGVLLSAGAKLLGNITIGDGAKVGAGSLVLEDVPANISVAGVPAKQIGKTRVPMPSLDMDHSIE
jgi:serine O-acetyltransferase